MNEVDTKRRCPWCLRSEQYLRYHDEEWGVPVHDDRRLFEFLILEGAQAGLSWSTILNKRDNYRRAFARFDPAKVARFGVRDVERWMADAGIVRNRLKIESAIVNARAFLGGRRGEVGGARAKRGKPLAVRDRLRIRRGPFEYRVIVRALSQHRGSPATAAALYVEDAEGKRLRERLAEQLRVAPSLRYEGKGRPTKKERRDIERLRGE